jgi:hypothetical protein
MELYAKFLRRKSIYCGLAEVLKPPPQVTNPQSVTFDEGLKI